MKLRGAFMNLNWTEFPEFDEVHGSYDWNLDTLLGFEIHIDRTLRVESCFVACNEHPSTGSVSNVPATVCSQTETYVSHSEGLCISRGNLH